MNLLNNRMFDDGSLDCKNIVLAHEEGSDVYSGFTYLKEIVEPEVLVEIMDLINSRIDKGHFHLSVSHYNIYFGGVQLLEIQWD